MQHVVSRTLSAVSAFAVGGVILLSGSATATAAPQGGSVVGSADSTSAALRPASKPPTVIGNVAPKWLVGQRQQFDLGESTNLATIMGAQSCDPANPGATRPKAGRSWSYFDASDDTSGFSADLTITGWRDARGARGALRDVRTDSGLCTVIDGWVERAWAGSDRATHLLLINSTRHSAAAAIVKGTHVVAVTVTDWDGSDDEAAAAITAVQKAAGNV